MGSKPPRQAQEQALWAVSELAARFLEGEAELPGRDRAPQRLVEDLDLSLSRNGQAVEKVLENLGRILEETPSAASPRFLNQLFGGRDLPATIAEMLVPLANSSMYTYKVAGAQVLVEREVVNRMLAAVPYPRGEGAFSPGGSLANLTAMIVARNEALTGVRDAGLTGCRGTVYTSREGHYSIRKAAGILGLGRRSVRKVDVDSGGAMRPEDLERLIEADLVAGLQPLFVNATAGTTVLGAIDPLPEIARICRRHRIWLHVDGALGGSILLSKRYRHLLSGLEASDSFAWNAHKMMGVPLQCSVILFRESGFLERHLGESAGYLFQADEADLNPGTRSLQCGRRNDAVKLWTAWKVLGDLGYDQRLTSLMNLARETARVIDRDPDLKLICAPQTVNVCFMVSGVSSSAICDDLDRRAVLKIGHGTTAGGDAIRLVCVNPDLDLEQVSRILGEIKNSAAAVARKEPGHG